MKQSPTTTKKMLEELSANIANNHNKSQSIATLLRVPQHRKQYTMAFDAAKQCRVLGRTHGRAVLKQYLDELKAMFDKTHDQKALLAERKILNTIPAVSSTVVPSNTEERLFALMEVWSVQSTSPSSSMLATQVRLVEDLLESCSSKTSDDAINEQEVEEDGPDASDSDDGSDDSDIDDDMITESNGSEFQLELLLELAAKHFNNEYKGLLSESQMNFMMSYVTMDSDQFTAKVLLPLEESVSKLLLTLGATDPLFVEQSSTVGELIKKFGNDRKIISESNNKQHVAAINFYLSLVDLSDKINIKE